MPKANALQEPVKPAVEYWVANGQAGGAATRESGA